MKSTTHAHIALAYLHLWTHGEGRGTYSARVLNDCLLSLAGEQEVDLSSMSVLDQQQRTWLAEVIFGLEHLKRSELKSAAGVIEDPIILI